MSEEIHVERLTSYTPDVAEGIGRLMPYLSERLTDTPMDEELLRAIIESPHHDQLVARLDSRIVGAATLSVIMGPAAGKQGYLNDFVTERGTKGVGSLIWSEMEEWCKDQGIDLLNFTSKQDRLTAHLFYEYRGAKIRDTNVYRKDFSGDE
jgi:GNAT superfamily N-acetyltransferase